MHRHAAAKIAIGLFVILLGIVILMDTTFGLHFIRPGSLFWGGVIVVVSLIAIIDYGAKFWNIFFLIVGGYIALSGFGLFRGHFFAFTIAVVLILIGFSILRHRPDQSVGWSERGFEKGSEKRINYSSIFSPFKYAVYSNDFRGGSLSCIFSSMEIDLSGSEFSKEEPPVLDITVVFGRVTLKIPKGTEIHSNITHVAGSFDDHTVGRPENKAACLTITGSTVFGRIEAFS